MRFFCIAVGLQHPAVVAENYTVLSYRLSKGSVPFLKGVQANARADDFVIRCGDEGMVTLNTLDKVDEGVIVLALRDSRSTSF